MENKFGGGIDLSRYTSSNFPIQQQKLMSTMSLRIINYLPARVTLLVQGIRLFMTMCFGHILCLLYDFEVKKPTKTNENNAIGAIQLQQQDIILNRNLRCLEPKFNGKRENKTNPGYISVHNNGTNDLIYIFLTIIFFS